ncbi:MULTISPECIES: MarR family winged helix-turn-helix transcriptional regulator [Chitinophagaceae]
MPKENVINQVGALAISTRMQRLADALRKDGEQIYKLFDIDFYPKWFPVILTLKDGNALTITELADEIGYAHPSTIGLLRELEKKKLVVSKKDRSDERKRLIALSKTGLELANKMQPVWTIMKKGMEEIIDTQNNLLNAIEEVEARLQQQSYFQKVLTLKLEKENSKQ